MAIERRDMNRSDLFVREGMALEKAEESRRLVGEIRLAVEEAENWEEKKEVEEERELEEKKELEEERELDEEEEQKGVEEEESSSYSGSEEEEEEEEEEGRSSLSLLHLLTKNLAQVD